jgi:hypothetical protein
MKPVTEKQHGWLYRRGGRLALLPGEETAPAVYLRYAFLLQGSEIPIFPGVLVDDWGQERRDLGLYQWVYEEGQRFPRTEIFGYERDGSETQVFLRALEIFLKLPCFVYEKRAQPVDAGQQLQIVFLPDTEHEGKPERITLPEETGWPLRQAAVSWQRARPDSLGQYGWERVG